MKRISIGRNPVCDLNISETFGKVSNEHADIQMENGVLTFIDHSSNGTVINGKNIHHCEMVIKQGDKIILAESYELKWTEIERFFPSLHRSTERFDGSQVEVSARKTELFDGSQIGSASKATERFEKSKIGLPNNGRETEHLNSFSDKNIRGQVNEYSQAEIEDITEKWHMGAFLASWLWAISNRIYWPIPIIVVSLIPYIGQVASLFLCTYLGLNGYKLAWDKNSKYNFKKFISIQKNWTYMGIIVFIISIAVQGLSIYYILNLF